MINKELFVAPVCEKYPLELLEDRVMIEGNFCGLLLKDLTLFTDIGADINYNSMLTYDGRFLFSLAKTLRSKGFTVVDEVSFLANANAEMKDKVDNMGGFKVIQHLMDVVSDKNSDAIIDALNKSNVILRLYDKGFSPLKEVVLENGKKVIPLKMFSKWTSAEVLAYFEELVAKCSTDVHSDMITGEGYIDFDDDFINGLRNGEQLGVSFADCGKDCNGETIRLFPYLSNILNGFKRGAVHGIAAGSGTGKSTLCVSFLFAMVAQGEKVLVVNNEMDMSDYKVLFLEWILTRYFNYWKLTKKRLINGSLTDEDLEMIHKAREVWREKYAKSIKIVTLADADMKLTLQIIKKEVLRSGITCTLIDTFKLTMQNGTKDNYYLDLIEDVREYTSMAVKYDLIALMTVQLSMSAISGKLYLDASCLSSSKQIVETMSTLLLCRKTYEAELIPDSPYWIGAFRRKKDANGAWYEEAFEPRLNEQYLVIQIQKNRRGEDSQGNGCALLMRQQLDYCLHWESAFCRPKHGNIDKI